MPDRRDEGVICAACGSDYTKASGWSGKPGGLTPLSHNVGHFLVRYQGEEMSLRGPQNLKARGRFTLDEL